MKRRRGVAVRGGRAPKRSQLRHVVESEELSDSSTATQPTRVASDDEEEKRGEDLNGSGGASDEEEEEELLDFTQTDYATQHASQRSASAEETAGEGSKAKSPSMPAKIAQLSDKAVEDLTAQLVRYMLYKGGLKLPIKFGDISKDVYPTYKNVSRFFFHRAKKQLERIFGYQVVPVDDSTAKEVYLVINAAASQEHWQLLNKTDKSPARGLLMMVLGLLWCAAGRRLSEEDLWKQMERVDSRVKENREHPQLGDVSQLMKTFETQMYLQSTTEIDNDSKKIKFYSYGARTFKEVGKPQILNFVCKLITGRPPTDTQLDEVLMEDK